MDDAQLLDTSALMTFIEDEAGADVVEAALLDSDSGRSKLYACFVSLTEVEYITLQERGEPAAQARMISLRQLPIHWIHSDEALCSTAAKLKAAHRISFADAFVAAAAIRLDAILIHKDPEFLALAQSLKQLSLPPKN